jgi:hypothetical protein
VPKADSVYEVLQKLVFPRATLSPEDAMYTARFFLLLLDLDVPCYSSLRYLDIMIRAGVALVLAATDQEAINLGLFLATLLKPLDRYAKDTAAFKDVVKKVGAVGSIAALRACRAVPSSPCLSTCLSVGCRCFACTRRASGHRSRKLQA